MIIVTESSSACASVRAYVLGLVALNSPSHTAAQQVRRRRRTHPAMRTYTRTTHTHMSARAPAPAQSAIILYSHTSRTHTHTLNSLFLLRMCRVCRVRMCVQVVAARDRRRVNTIACVPCGKVDILTNKLRRAAHVCGS